ncbi:MAG: hypothetical protein MJB57_01130 [Gemmatimonadetes bacterium]|nr:hypothetical protein [Gemmatimonadota bacterium]
MARAHGLITPGSRNRRALLASATIPAIAVILAAVIQAGGSGDTLLTPTAPTTTVQIQHPRHGSVVPQFVDVRYRLSGEIASGHQAYAIVRDPLGQFWPWRVARSGERSSPQAARVQIGTAEDGGQPFEIGILVTDTALELGQPLTILPAHSLYEFVKVTRR